MQIVTSADFEAEVLKSKIPVLVDFFADWCGPCKQLAPILETIAKEKAGKLKIVKVDVDASPELAAQYFVRSMPTLAIIKNGEVIAREVGAAPKSNVVKWIDGALALPVETKPDLAPKAVELSDNDKKRLRDAFNEAVNKSPDADTPAILLTDDDMLPMVDGKIVETTLRKEIEKGLSDGSIFKIAAAVMAEGQMSLDKYIKLVKHAPLTFPPKL